MSDCIDITISDTLGDQFGQAFRQWLPDVRMMGHAHPDAARTQAHNHGAWCGWLAGIPCQVEAKWAGKEICLHFVQFFDHDGRELPGASEFLMEKILEIRPAVVSRSWGGWDRDDELAEMFMRAQFNEWGPQYVSLMQELQFVDVAAAGNHDNNDPDDDVATPQKWLKDQSLVIGSIDQQGIPVRSSGDGEAVTCVMWGDEVISAGVLGYWHGWSGTSAACPKMAGVVAAQELSRIEALELIRTEATRPNNGPEWNPKWGYGSCEHLWQYYAHMMAHDLWPTRSAEILSEKGIY